MVILQDRDHFDVILNEEERETAVNRCMKSISIDLVKKGGEYISVLH